MPPYILWKWMYTPHKFHPQKFTWQRNRCIHRWCFWHVPIHWEWPSLNVFHVPDWTGNAVQILGLDRTERNDCYAWICLMWKGYFTETTKRSFLETLQQMKLTPKKAWRQSSYRIRSISHWKLHSPNRILWLTLPSQCKKGSSNQLNDKRCTIVRFLLPSQRQGNKQPRRDPNIFFLCAARLLTHDEGTSLQCHHKHQIGIPCYKIKSRVLNTAKSQHCRSSKFFQDFTVFSQKWKGNFIIKLNPFGLNDF